MREPLLSTTVVAHRDIGNTLSYAHSASRNGNASRSTKTNGNTSTGHLPAYALSHEAPVLVRGPARCVLCAQVLVAGSRAVSAPFGLAHSHCWREVSR